MRQPEAGRPAPAHDARQLGILNAVAEALNSSADVRRALERTLDLAAERLGLTTGWVWLLDPGTHQFYLAAARNLPPYLQEPVRMSARWCLCTDQFRHGKLAAKNVDVLECSRLAPAVAANDLEATRGLHAHASIPLAFRDTPLGILNLAGPAWHTLSHEELELLSTIAYQVGIAVERARLAEESARLARLEERARIAREIHDTLVQGLTAIALQVEGALGQVERDPARARARLEQALATARASLEEARRSVLDLRTSPPAGQPLGESLAALGRAFTADTGVPVHLRAGPALPALSPEVEAELYGIAREALANVRKHAGARLVEITLEPADGGVRLAIHDDGRGFDPRQAWQAGSGYGLRGMKERARLLGGTLLLRSRLSGGTTVSVRVPHPDAREPG